METIYIDYGLYTDFTVDLTDFDFTGIEKVVLTVKGYSKNDYGTILTRTYTSAGSYTETITPDESKLFGGEIRYDFIKFTSSGEVYRVSDVGKMILREGVGRVE